jgi:protein TonB
MFENALVESAGRLKTQSKFWTLGTFALNAGVLALMILLPLLHPEALPKTTLAAMLVAPAPPPPPPPVQVAVQPAAPAAAQQSHIAVLTAPRIIPDVIREDSGPPSTPPIGSMPAASTPGDAWPGPNISTAITPRPVVVVSRPAERVRVSTGVAAGNLISQTQPVYPAIARAAGITGVVVLRAIISKTGTIENLTVQSGPVLLRQAALEGVRNWRYKPFLLNGDPTDVDTTITVNFTSGS